MRICFKVVLCLTGLLALASAVQAEVKLPTAFSDHMVMQHDVPVPVWGWADAGEKITVQIGKQTKTTVANAGGKWMLKLDKLKAGGPYSLTISGKNRIVISDVYAGEVWICSGQSNMDMTVAKEDRYWCGVFNEATEVAAADYPLIRVFDTDFTPTATPQDDVVGKWEVVSPKTIGHLSAVAYFFARDIQKKIKNPIGLITTA
jgi:sialate O-acetylesterase